MKRYLPWMAMCALLVAVLAGGIYSPVADAQQPDLTTTVTAPAPELELPVKFEPAPIVAQPAPLYQAAPAPADSDDEWTRKDTAKYIIEPFISPLAILVEGLVGCLILALTLLINRYLGVRVSEKHLAMANELADAGLHYAEEKAREAVKVEGKEPPKGAEKARLALDFATGLAVQAKLPSKLTSYLENLIKARLGRSRG